MMFLFAFLGGVILNMMPCVFPILSLKVLTLLGNRSSIISGISYTMGVLACFLIITGILVILKNMGFVIGWGYNLQSPMFTIFLTYLLFAVGLNLSSFFSIPMPAFSDPNTQNSMSNFFVGVLSVLVATPCTAPFMATAIGFAFTQSSIVTLLVFQVLGLGFAFPYLILSVFPKLLSFLPKPGHWMNVLKEFLAFPMYVSSAWLLWISVRSGGSVNLIFTISIGLIIMVMTIWAHRLVRTIERKDWRICLSVILIFANIVPLKMSYSVIYDSREENYVTFSSQKLTAALAEHKKVFVAVTADWCITCKINEKLVLSSDTIQDAFLKHEVIYMLADWTKHNEEITQYMNDFNRDGVPLYVLYHETGDHEILPQILTQRLILSELAK